MCFFHIWSNIKWKIEEGAAKPQPTDTLRWWNIAMFMYKFDYVLLNSALKAPFFWMLLIEAYFFSKSSVYTIKIHEIWTLNFWRNANASAELMFCKKQPMYIHWKQIIKSFGQITFDQSCAPACLTSNFSCLHCISF